jgi:hypothetical protein
MCAGSCPTRILRLTDDKGRGSKAHYPDGTEFDHHRWLSAIVRVSIARFIADIKSDLSPAKSV